MLTDAKSLRLERFWGRLLRRGMRVDRLGFLLTVFAGTVPRDFMSFNTQVNTLTDALLLDRVRNDRWEPVPGHEALLILQLNMESIAFLMLLRHLVDVATCRGFEQIPFAPNRGEYQISRKDGLVTFRKATILRRIVEDLDDAGFSELAQAMRSSHNNELHQIRNAIAHSTFRIPDERHEGTWVFGSYRASPDGHLNLESLQISTDDLNHLVREFFRTRFALYRALERVRSRLADRTFSFRAVNRQSGAEFDCTFANGTIRLHVINAGTPLPARERLHSTNWNGDVNYIRADQHDSSCDEAGS